MALPQVDYPKPVQLTGLTGVVADAQVDGERLAMAPSRLPVTALAVIGNAEVAKRTGLADPVAVLTADGQCLLEVPGGPAKTSLGRVASAEHRQCGGAGGMAVHSSGLSEVADIQVTEDGGGQADRVAGPSVVGGMSGDADKGRSLHVQPCQRRGRAGDRRHRAGGLW